MLSALRALMAIAICAGATHDAIPERIAHLIASDELLTWGGQRCELANLAA